MNILYLHGFNSSPQSEKAEITKQYIEKHHNNVNFHCPQLMSSPNAVIEQLERILQVNSPYKWGIIGSSLGGYFATYLSEKYSVKAVLINPAVKPFELLVDYLGEQTNPYTQEVYQVSKRHMHELKALYEEKISKKNYMVMVQTGDEVLDYHQAAQRYHDTKLIIQQGGNHHFVNYQKMLPNIMKFMNL